MCFQPSAGHDRHNCNRGQRPTVIDHLVFYLQCVHCHRIIRHSQDLSKHLAHCTGLLILWLFSQLFKSGVYYHFCLGWLSIPLNSFVRQLPYSEKKIDAISRFSLYPAFKIRYNIMLRELVGRKANVQGNVLPGYEAWFRLVHNSR